MRGVKFGLNVRVGEENEIEVAGGWRLGLSPANIEKPGAWQDCRGARGCERLQKFSAIEIHSVFLAGSRRLRGNSAQR